MPEAMEDRGAKLMKTLSEDAKGYRYEEVINASTSLFINILKQSCSTPEQAAQAFDDITERLRITLLSRYVDVPRRGNGISPNLLEAALLDPRKKN